MSAKLGVGFIGAGPVTQAIHLPTLATLADRFRVAHVMDVDEQVAAVVAARADAQSTTQLDTLLEDPEVDVVAICSPDRFHADQVAAVAAAGKRAILCEKPLATTVEEAQRIADVSVTSGVPSSTTWRPIWRPAAKLSGVPGAQPWGTGATVACWCAGARDPHDSSGPAVPADV